jgi:hypothetical protein
MTLLTTCTICVESTSPALSSAATSSVGRLTTRNHITHSELDAPWSSQGGSGHGKTLPTTCTICSEERRPRQVTKCKGIACSRHDACAELPGQEQQWQDVAGTWAICMREASPHQAIKCKEVAHSRHEACTEQQQDVTGTCAICAEKRRCVNNESQGCSQTTHGRVSILLACLMSTLNLSFCSSNAPRSNISDTSQQRLSPPTGPSPTFSLVGSLQHPDTGSYYEPDVVTQ